MSKQYNNIEIVNITRACFPKRQPITVTAERDIKVTLKPGDIVAWRELGDTYYFLRNNQWFRKLTIHFVKPIKGKADGGH